MSQQSIDQNPIVTVDTFDLLNARELAPLSTASPDHTPAINKPSLNTKFKKEEREPYAFKFCRQLVNDVQRAEERIRAKIRGHEASQPAAAAADTIHCSSLSMRVEITAVVEANAHACFSRSASGTEQPEDNTKAFVIVGLLEEREADYVMAVASPHLRPLDTLYAQRTRMADRAMIRSPKVAQQLYQRLLPHLKKEDYAERTPLCFGQDGVWAPLGLNDCLKVFRYSPGGLFVEHRDGPWVPRQDQCSMFTVVVYLNDDFDGGETGLYGSADECAPKGYRETLSYPSLLVTPVTGMALLLNHDCWHCAAPVVEGTKWILRTELIFQRVHSFYVDKNAFASSEDYLATRALYDASMQASDDGDRELFFSSYQEVVRRQREAMLREEACRKPRLLAALGLEELSVILSHLRDPEIASLLRLNRRTHIAVVQAPYWQDRYEASVRSAGPAVPKLLGPNLLSSLHWFRDHLTGSSETTNTSHTHGDYFGLVRQRLWLKRQFIPTGLILLDSGSVMAIPRPKPKIFEHAYLYTRNPRPKFNEVISYASTGGDVDVTHPKLLYSLHKSERFYGFDRYAARGRYHMNRPDGETLAIADDPASIDEAERVICPITGLVCWSVLSVPVEQLITPTQSPLLIVGHPAWFTRGKEIVEAREALDALFNLSRFPAVAFCHPAVCAIIGYLSTLEPSSASSKETIVVEMRCHCRTDDPPFDDDDDDQDEDEDEDEDETDTEKENNTENSNEECPRATNPIIVYRFRVQPDSMQATDIPNEFSQGDTSGDPAVAHADLMLVDCAPQVWPYHILGRRFARPIIKSSCPSAVFTEAVQQAPSGQVVLDMAEVMALGIQAMLASPSITEAFLYRH